MKRADWVLRVRPVELAELLKRVLRVRRQVFEVGDLRLWLDPVSNLGARLLHDGEYEPHMTKLIQDHLAPGEVFVDLGANEGFFSLAAAKRVGRDGRVFAIEPQSRLWPVLLRNFTLNEFCQCTLVPYVVAEQGGEVSLTLYPSINTGASTAAAPGRFRHFAVERCQALPLSVLVDRYRMGRIALMKVDIEGFELAALRSLGAYLANGLVRTFLIEVHPQQLAVLGSHPDELVALLARHGYRQIGAGDPQVWTLQGQ